MTRTLAAWLLVQLALMGLQQQQVQSSSYLGDYFLPTAKLALNKLQQSFAPNALQTRPAELVAGANSSSTSPATDSGAEFAATGRQPAQNAPGDAMPRADEPPNKNEFVRLETSAELAPVPVSQSDQVELANQANQSASSSPPPPPQPPLVVPSTEATDSDPSGEPAASGAVSPATEVAVGEPAQTAAQPTERTAQSETPAPNEQSQESAQVQVGAQPEQGAPGKPANLAETVRETELEAQAAVDASIGFGDLFASLSDTCYDEYGNARYCEPEFENAAYAKQVEVSSECGSPPSRFCTAYLNEHNDQIRNCHICDAQHPKKRHPAVYLTDINNSNSATCWVSAPISVSAQNESSAGSAGSDEPGPRSDNVTLVLNLEKKYEITYVSVQFCSLKPDSLAIFKSADFGQSWQPYQFYSSQCQRMYGRAPSPRSSGAELEARCANGSLPASRSAGNAGRLAFSTLEGRSGGQLAVDRSPALQDWISATNIKIVLDRHQAIWMQPSLAHHRLVNEEPRNLSGSTTPSQSQSQLEPESSLTSPSNSFNYAIADLTVGGRCKCNGHASRCVHSGDGQLQCDCRHNTAGRDCERCAALHHDRPWSRATQFDANPCQPCNCNGHSRKCHFDAELYKLSGRRSGGVCTYCKDNTAGRHCHYCREGFTRDHSKPMSDKEACRHCDCHPIGSLGRVCNQTTGQCPCKEGVAGLQCNRCLPGHQQSSSLMEPCIKLPDNDINSSPSFAFDEDTPAPSGELRPTGNRIDAPELDADSPDRDQDGELSIGSDELGQARKQLRQPAARFNRKQQHFATNYYRPPNNQRARQQFARDPNEIDDDEEPPSSMLSFAEDPRAPNGQPENDFRYLPAARYPTKPLYGGYNRPRYQKDHGHPANLRPSSSGRARSGEPALQRQPVAGLDQADELNSLDEPEVRAADAGYPLLNPAASSSLYTDDHFNQIQTDSQSAPRYLQTGRNRPASGRHRFAGAGGHGELPMGPSNDQVCGECQSGTRRLVFRQFCHLNYATKATVLSKYVAADWTRFEVEILDVFKSAAASQSYADNMVQSDEPELGVAANQRLASNRTEGESALEQPAPSNQNRLKVGAVLSIWVPTEDLACRCPRLKPRSTYLLMGSIDAKENSANSLQLDRHGVALEWRSSMQEKLVRYQRRLARGRC